MERECVGVLLPAAGGSGQTLALPWVAAEPLQHVVYNTNPPSPGCKEFKILVINS